MNYPSRLPLLVVLALICADTSPAVASNYYLDSRAGNDSHSGASRSSAWRTLNRLASQQLAPGDSVLFAAGSSFTGGVTISASGTAARPIVISRYGRGRPPAFSNREWRILNGNIFHVEGKHVVLDGLYFHDNINPPSGAFLNEQGTRIKNVQKMGAVYLAVGADSNIVRNCEFFHTPVGIKIKGRYALVTRNNLHDATEPMERTWGAIAIMVVSPDNEISWNRITNYGYYGGAYGSDGGAIELDGVDDAFDGRKINIHHNISIGNHGFLELAGKVTDSITVAYNLSDDTDKFIGGGAMKHTFIYNNTVIRTREPNIDRYMFWTFYPDSTALILRNNIFVVPADIKVLGALVRYATHHRTAPGWQPHDHNLYFSSSGKTLDPLGVSPGEGDIISDPRFADASKKDYHLTSKSPARHRGAALGFKTDLDGKMLPVTGNPDLGAYQYRARR